MSDDTKILLLIALLIVCGTVLVALGNDAGWILYAAAVWVLMMASSP